MFLFIINKLRIRIDVMKKFEEFISVATKEKRYSPFIIRCVIEVIIFGGISITTFFLIPIEYITLRLIPALTLLLTIYCILACLLRCFNVHDNVVKANLKKKKIKEKYKPVSIDREDFIFYLKNAELAENLIIKSSIGQLANLEISAFDGGIEYYFNDEEMDLLSLIKKLEDENYLDDTIHVSEITDHNKPELLSKVIEYLKKKKHE